MFWLPGIGVALGVLVAPGMGVVLGVLVLPGVWDGFGVVEAAGVDVGVICGTPWVEPLPGHINPLHISPTPLLIIPATGCPTALRDSMPLTVACPPAIVMAERVNTSPAASTVPPIMIAAQSVSSKLYVCTLCACFITLISLLLGLVSIGRHKPDWYENQPR